MWGKRSGGPLALDPTAFTQRLARETVASAVRRDQLASRTRGLADLSRVGIRERDHPRRPARSRELAGAGAGVAKGRHRVGIVPGHFR